MIDIEEIPDDAGPGPAGAGRSRFRRIAGRRLAVAATLAIAAAALIGRGLVEGAARLAAWVAGRPEHAVRYDAIDLDPPPPPWIALNEAGFLEAVREGAVRPEALSPLGLDLAEIARDFAVFPWIERVERVVHRRGRLTLRLAYRKPAAIVRPAGSKSGWVVDPHGMILPADEIAWSDPAERTRPAGIARPLPSIVAIEPPTAPSPGLPYRVEGKPWADEGPDLRVLRCTRLAGFVQAKAEACDAGATADMVRPSITQIEPVVGGRKGMEADGIYAVDHDRRYIYWGSAPGAESSRDGIPAEVKWARLVAWMAGHGADPSWTTDVFLYFTADGMAIKRFNEPDGRSARREGRSSGSLSR